MFDYTEYSVDGGKSSVRAYSDTGSTVVLESWDATSFSDGVHVARVDISLDAFLAMADKIRADIRSEEGIKGYAVIAADTSENRRMHGPWNTPEDAQKVQKALEVETPWPWTVATVRKGQGNG